MVKHIVFFKLKEGSEANKAELKEKLLSMKGVVEPLENIEVGINFSDEARAYDVALLTDFNSKESLEKYAVHPYHLEVISYVKSVAEASKVVDFEY